MLQLSLLKYFKLKGFPDPDGPLSESVNLRPITWANREVLEEIKKTKLNPKKRGRYIK